ncbi:MAG: sugar ABC transporter permease, partial [Yonghaparkia sp.]|nr:sugar ABC transporter permease [Microcella sp.]
MTFRWAMLAPVLTITGVAVGFPLGYALYLSLTDYRLTSRGAPDFVGLDNYFFVLTDPRMWNAFSNTAIYVIVAVALQTVLGLAIALALQKQKWARDLTRAMLLAPMFITPIAV